ncbi:MAG: hypothetical protein U0670_06670 [Anaerolineae bacterium]
MPMYLKAPRIFSGHTNTIQAMDLTSDGQFLLTGGKDCSARLWRIETGEQVKQLNLGGKWVFGIHLALDERHAVVQFFGLLWLCDLSFKYPVWTHGARFTAVGPDKRTLLTGGADYPPSLWDLITKERLVSCQPTDHKMDAAAFSPDGKRIIVNQTIWDAATGEIALKLETQAEAGLVYRPVFSPDGTRIAGEYSYGVAGIWDASTGALLHKLEGHRYGIWDCAFSPDNRFLVTSSEDSTMRAWNVETGEHISWFGRTQYPVTSVRFTSDGKWIVGISFMEWLVWENEIASW